jgi:hypothetical protein
MRTLLTARGGKESTVQSNSVFIFELHQENILVVSKL